MNGLDTIIRDNLKWHARALVAAEQRGSAKLAGEILDASPSGTGYDETFLIFEEEYYIAARERRATRGL